MDPRVLHDLICRGMGRAARAVGHDYDLFRPRGTQLPLSTENLMMRLPVIFDEKATGSGLEQVFGRGHRATFDSISTQVGDYLRGERGVFFVASVPDRQRPWCVPTNATVDVLRMEGPALAGLNGYGGVSEAGAECLLRSWPVSLGISSAGARGALPGDGGQGVVEVLFPPTPEAIRPADLLRDDRGRRFVVLTADAGRAGQRLTARGADV